MLSLNNLGLTIGNRKLLHSISMSLLPSAIIYLKGKNGMGKTSILRMIAGIQKPTDGEINFGQKNFNISRLEKPYCLYIGHNIAVNPQLTVFENIKFWAEIYDSAELIEAAVNYFHLYEMLDTKCYKLSAGNKKKVALCRLIACDSNLWLLDEIDSNLDEETRKQLNNLIITKANNGGIIFISSHNKTEIESAITIDIKDYVKT